MQQQHRALGALPRYANGGLIDKAKAALNQMVGNNPTAMKQRGRSETQDAPPYDPKADPAVRKMAGGGFIDTMIKGAKRIMSDKPAAPATAPETPATPAATPAPATAISDYAGNAALKKREAAAGLKKGGAVKGPGTGTSDDIPIMASNGEYMIKAAAVRKLGVPLLDTLNAIADGDKKPAKKAKPARGAVPKMRDGGSVDEELRKAQTRTGRVAPYVNHRAPTGAPAMQAPLQIGNSAPPPGSAVATQPYRPNFTMPGEGAQTRVVPEAPKVTDVRAKYNPANASPEAKAYMADRAANPGPQPAGAQPAAQPQPAKPTVASRAAQAGGRAVGAVRSAINSPIARTIVAPAVAGISAGETFDTPTSDYETRFGFGPSSSDSPAVNLVRDIGVRALGAASDLGNTMTGGLAGQFYRDKQAKAGQLTPSDPVPAAPAGALPPPVPAPAAAPAQVTAGIPAPAQPTGQVTRVGNSYSGANVSGPVTINGREPRGGFVGGTGDGTFTYGGTGGQSGGDQALQAARMAALQAGDVDAVRASYGGNFGGWVAGDEAEQALMNNGRPMTARKLGAINKARADRESAAGVKEDRAMARTKGALDNKKTSLEIKAAESLLAAQDRLNSAKTEAERGIAMKELMALQGKYDKELPNRFTVVPGGQAITDQGVPYTVPARVINNQTGQFVEQPQASTAPKVTTQAEFDKLPKGATYTGADGKTYRK